VAKPQDLTKFGAFYEGTRIRRLRCLNKITVALEEIWLDNGFGIVDHQDLNDSIYQFYTKN
jgi:DNA-binding GntR family transcriptional regulator